MPLGTLWYPGGQLIPSTRPSNHAPMGKIFFIVFSGTFNAGEDRIWKAAWVWVVAPSEVVVAIQQYFPSGALGEEAFGSQVSGAVVPGFTERVVMVVPSSLQIATWTGAVRLADLPISMERVSRNPSLVGLRMGGWIFREKSDFGECAANALVATAACRIMHVAIADNSAAVRYKVNDRNGFKTGCPFQYLRMCVRPILPVAHRVLIL